MAYVSLHGPRRRPASGLGRQSDGPPPSLCTGKDATEMARLAEDCKRNLNDLCAKFPCPVPIDSRSVWDPAMASVGYTNALSCKAKLAGYMKVCGAVKDLLLAGAGQPLTTDPFAATRQASATMAASSGAAAAQAEAAAKLQQSLDPIRSTASAAASASAAAAAKSEAAYRAKRQQQVRNLALVGGGIVVVGAGLYLLMRR